MLKKTSRISRKVFPKGGGKRVSFPYGTIVFGAAPTAVFSVVVSKKAVPKAVDRNRLRRRAYSIVRKSALPVPRSVVIHLDRKSASATFQEFQSALSNALR